MLGYRRQKNCTLRLTYQDLTLVQALQILSHIPQLPSNRHYFGLPQISQNNFLLLSLLPPSMLLISIEWLAVCLHS